MKLGIVGDKTPTNQVDESFLCLTKLIHMKKWFKTIFLTLALVFTSMTTLPSEDNFNYTYALSKQTPESLHVLKSFGISLKESKLVEKYPAMSPINPQDITRISSFYGERMHPIYRSKQIHRGIDFASPKGTPVVATGDGTVTGTKSWGGYGRQVTIEHKDGYYTRYAHLSKILVDKGDVVAAGDTVGQVGSTGLSTGNHLHYEISHQNKVIDPMSIFPDTLKGPAYLDYLENLNDHYTSSSDFLFII